MSSLSAEILLLLCVRLSLLFMSVRFAVCIFVYLVKKMIWPDCIFVCLSLSLFVNYFADPMDSLSLLGKLMFPQITLLLSFLCPISFLFHLFHSNSYTLYSINACLFVQACRIMHMGRPKKNPFMNILYIYLMVYII